MPLHEFITLFIGISVFLSESVLCYVINSKCSVCSFSWTDRCVCVCVLDVSVQNINTGNDAELKCSSSFIFLTRVTSSPPTGTPSPPLSLSNL